jgi:hypothetical protein
MDRGLGGFNAGREFMSGWLMVLGFMIFF